jgi:putative ABC transport system permease protein
MIRHLFRLLLNRKRASALVVAEIVMSFLVLTVVIGGIAHFSINWNRPLGYDAANVWSLNVAIPPGEATGNREETNERFSALLREVGATRGVESAAGAMMSPYGLGDWTNDFGSNNRVYHVNNVTDAFAETMRLEIVRGRWFGREDDGVDWQPVVLNQEAVRRYFPSGIEIGDVINPDADADETRRRVIGIVAEFRKAGELQTPQPFAFLRTNLDNPSAIAPDNILLRVAEGTSTDLEVELIEKAQLIAPEWTFEIRPLSVMRRGSLRLQLAPLIAGAVIAGSMILLVALGLTGVTWQNVTRRTQEIGLRRAVGASGLTIQRQILAETMIIAAIGLIIGIALIAQAPLAGVQVSIDGDGIRPAVVATGIGGAALMILAIVALCSWYPSRLASSIEPAEALHYE